VYVCSPILEFVLPSPHVKAPATPNREHLRNQIRKLGSLSQGIRGLQAKMQILREESNKSLEQSDNDVTEFGANLMIQYDSIGADLKNLMQAWENGKAALALNIDRAERRISMASSPGIRSPVSSLSGLTAVEETGSPADALRALNGEFPPRSSSASAASVGNTSDEEIFEAIAMPRVRARMTQEERRAKIETDRVRHAAAREQREAEHNMLKELESVIRLRPVKQGQKDNTSKRMSTGRITTL
jgi:hypothetical protein